MSHTEKHNLIIAAAFNAVLDIQDLNKKDAALDDLIVRCRFSMNALSFIAENITPHKKSFNKATKKLLQALSQHNEQQWSEAQNIVDNAKEDENQSIMEDQNLVPNLKSISPELYALRPALFDKLEKLQIKWNAANQAREANLFTMEARENTLATIAADRALTRHTTMSHAAE